MRPTLSYEYPADLSEKIGRVCLEMSLKPFLQLDDAYISEVCRTLFDQWRPLTRYAKSVAVMLWTSDGSEILVYDGNPATEFEWGKYIGIGNPNKFKGQNPTEKGSLHVQPVLYTENPVKFTYGDLARVVKALKKIGQEEFGLDVQVGETFDPGPEFAYSEFKFERHPEISPGSTMVGGAWLYCASRLHADSYRYAAYPDGIPEGTHLGEFLGKQFMALSRDVGFDFIWLSNGFGFSLNSWSWTGELFDGEKYDFSSVAHVRDAINEFWVKFSENMPGQLVEARGSNLSTGMDICAHGCPIDDIYTYPMIAPPNSPWAALDFRFGLELVGYMSHIAALPAAGYLFRYYIHDPWWINSPWFDRYGRSPHDIYLPLSVARMDEKGHTTPPRGINFLSADDSFGQLPYRCPDEVIPHLLEAYQTFPDAPGTLTWVYPFADDCRMGLREGKTDRLMMGDWLIEAAVDLGFPLNSVVADAVLADYDLSDKNSVYRETVLVFPVPESGSQNEKTLLRALENGYRVLLYGAMTYAGEEVRRLAGVTLGEPVEGEMALVAPIYADRAESDQPAGKLYHDAIVSDGGICEISDESTEVMAAVECEGKKRAYATWQPKAGRGQLVWVRGSFPHRRTKDTLPPQIPMTEFFSPALLLRSALVKFGIFIAFDSYSCTDKLPIIFHARQENALWFTEFCKDATVCARMSLPDGAPAPADTEFLIEENVGRYPLCKWFHRECRTYIKQKKKAKITVRTMTVNDCIYDDHHLLITGLCNAEVTFTAPENHIVYFRMGEDAFWHGSNVAVTQNGCRYVAKGLTGDLHIGWQRAGKREEYKKLEIDGYDRES